MTDPETLLRSLRHRGVRLWVDGEHLRVECPPGALMTQDVDCLRASKADIIALLQGQSAGLPALTRRPPASEVPLTAMQDYYWRFVAEPRGGLGRRFCTITERIRGQLDEERLRESLAMVCARHESLRTHIALVDGRPTQSIARNASGVLEDIDLSAQHALASDDDVQRLAQELVDEDVDLCSGPLVRMWLVRRAAQEHVLIVALNHIIADGASKKLLSKQIWDEYRARSHSQPEAHASPSLQFADYAVWQRRAYNSLQARHSPYWVSHLAGASGSAIPCPGTTGSFDNLLVARFEHSNAGAAATGALRHFAWGTELTARLDELARERRVPLSVIALAIYVSVASLWCQTNDVLLMMVLHGRDRPQLRDMIGYLANVVPLRIATRFGETFDALVQRVAAEVYAAYEHQDVGVDFIPDHPTELYFNWRPIGPGESQPGADPNPARILVQPFPFRPALAIKFLPLFSHTEEGIVVSVLYRRDLFESGTVDLFCRSLFECALQVAHQPYVRLEHIKVPCP